MKADVICYKRVECFFFTTLMDIVHCEASLTL